MWVKFGRLMTDFVQEMPLWDAQRVARERIRKASSSTPKHQRKLNQIVVKYKWSLMDIGKVNCWSEA